MAASTATPCCPSGPSQGPAGAHAASRATLPKALRLLKSAEFRQAFDGGPQWPSRTLVLWVRREADARGRVGVVASKRTFRRAVDRNRARRLLREAFRRHRHGLRSDVDLVLLARRRILEARAADVERDLLRVGREAGLLVGDGPS